MPAFCFNKAKASGALIESDYKRIIAMYLATPDWHKFNNDIMMKAAEVCDSTPGSMGTQMGKMFKRLRDKDCYLDEKGSDGAAQSMPPKGTPKKASTPKKRKMAETGAGADEGAVKKTAKKARGTEAAVKAEDIDEDAGGNVSEASLI